MVRPALGHDPFHYTHLTVSASFVDTAPVPTPGTPYLQSGRLFPPSIEGHSGLNRSTVKQMGAILEELKVPKEPLPSRRCCDLYDGVRKDALTLLILQKMVLRKEAELDQKSARLMEMRAAAVAKEEATRGKTAAEEGGAPEGGGDSKTAEGTGKGGGKGKKAKGKRQRVDSLASAGSSEAVAAAAAAAVAEEVPGKKGGGGGDGTKKKYRKKAKVDAASVGGAAGGPSTAPSGAMAPPVAVASSTPNAAVPETGAAMSPIVSSGKQKQQQRPTAVKKVQNLPLSSPMLAPSSAGAAEGTMASGVGSSGGVAMTVGGGGAAPAATIHPGKTAKKPGKKRGRKKSSAS